MIDLQPWLNTATNIINLYGSLSLINSDTLVQTNLRPPCKINEFFSSNYRKKISLSISVFIFFSFFCFDRFISILKSKNEKIVKIIKTTLGIRSQIDVEKYHMQPLQLRYFYHFLSFTYSAFNNCPECGLVISILSFK